MGFWDEPFHWESGEAFEASIVPEAATAPRRSDDFPSRQELRDIADLERRQAREEDAA